MKIAFFDCFSGISGDMIVGAFLDAGLKLEVLKKELSKLPVSEFEISTETVRRNNIRAIKFNVISKEKRSISRNINDIIKILNNSTLNENVKLHSIRIFKRIARAESRVHGVNYGDVLFHEVGAIDSIVDIVSASVAFDTFGIERLYSTPVSVGEGMIEIEHGKLPVPAPGTLEILKNVRIKKIRVDHELTTPTGASILVEFLNDMRSGKEFIFESVGYGAGSGNWGDMPNLLRISIGKEVEKYSYDRSVVIETNIDDMNPEIYPYLSEKLFEKGALDVFYTQIIMKKGRPGVKLSIIATDDIISRLLGIVFNETTTAGVRIYDVDRVKVQREVQTVTTRFGDISVKKLIYGDGVKFIPEYEECRRIALSHNIPILQVYKEVEIITAKK